MTFVVTNPHHNERIHDFITFNNLLMPQTNYWDIETTLKAIELYNTGFSIEEIASALDRTSRSVIVKLAKEGVYNKPSNTKRLRKEEILSRICVLLELENSSLDTLKLGTHEQLTLLLNSLQKTLENHT